MAAPRQAGKAGAGGRAGGNGTKARDKGTRGGRPEAPAPASQRRQGGGKARAGNGQGRRAAAPDRKRPGQPASRTGAAALATEELADGSRKVPLWLQLSTLILAIIGLADSVYLTIAHFTSSTVLACSDNGVVNCGLVTTSPESELFGIFPVAVLGLAFYVFLVAIMTPWAWRAKWPAIGWARIGSLIVGIVFVLYLVYTELFTLGGHICLYCTYVHIVTFLLFGLTMFAAASGYGIAQARARR
ncbi:MAG TPA: vitamin K epoxide reductase family protein [Streptosporangiaceae bacterium]|jgi:uncharacterized membrane protein